MTGKTKFQVAIAGGGPGGAILARDLARAGVSAAIFEDRPEGAQGHNWSDAVEKNALEAAGFEMPIVRNGCNVGTLVKRDENDENLFEKHAVETLEIRAPDLSGKTRTDAGFHYITTDRKVLNRMLLSQAADAGASIFYNHRADRLIGQTGGSLEDISIHGMTVIDLDTGTKIDITADITVDATGYLSKLRTAFPDAKYINRPFAGGDLAYACRTVRKLDVTKTADDDLANHYRYGAFRGYFWTHRHFDDVIDVGGGVREEPGRVDPRDIIEEMISKRPSITDRELRSGGGIVLVGRSPYSLVASGFAAVGDAAGQVIPTTGCGAGGALVGGMLAAETVIDAMREGKKGIDALWAYNWKWFLGNGRGRHFAALSALREILQDLSHEELAFLMKKDILSGEMLTPTINGRFQPTGIGDMLKTLSRGISRPALLIKLNQATSLAKTIFHHYQGYPETWRPDSFYSWVAGVEKVLLKMRS